MILHSLILIFISSIAIKKTQKTLEVIQILGLNKMHMCIYTESDSSSRSDFSSHYGSVIKSIPEQLFTTRELYVISELKQLWNEICTCEINGMPESMKSQILASPNTISKFSMDWLTITINWRRSVEIKFALMWVRQNGAIYAINAY